MMMHTRCDRLLVSALRQVLSAGEQMADSRGQVMRDRIECTDRRCYVAITAPITLLYGSMLYCMSGDHSVWPVES